MNFGEFFVTGIAFGCLSIIFNVFAGHLDRFLEFEPVVDITGYLHKEVYNLFGNVLSLVLLGVVYQFGFVDGIVETLDLVAKPAGVMLLILNGARLVGVLLHRVQPFNVALKVCIDGERNGLCFSIVFKLCGAAGFRILVPLIIIVGT
jgi:hypothetical protein